MIDSDYCIKMKLILMLIQQIMRDSMEEINSMEKINEYREEFVKTRQKADMFSIRLLVALTEDNAPNLELAREIFINSARKYVSGGYFQVHQLLTSYLVFVLRNKTDLKEEQIKEIAEELARFDALITFDTLNPPFPQKEATVN